MHQADVTDDRRLELAERLCVLYGRAGTCDGGDTIRDATIQAWWEWWRTYGGEAAQVGDDEVRRLAERRAEIRARAYELAEHLTTEGSHA